MKYRAGYKYQLDGTFSTTIGLVRGLNYPAEVYTAYATLEDGILTIKAGYAWDGPSGPTFDTSNFMRGSLVHDVLYQFMREEKLPKSDRKFADELLRKMCREDGMSWVRAWWVYRGVRLFAGKASLPSRSRPIMRAP